jgi:hypothetical protein
MDTIDIVLLRLSKLVVFTAALTDEAIDSRLLAVGDATVIA